MLVKGTPGYEYIWQYVPRCMSGSLTCSGGENVPNIHGACATRNFMYLARDQCSRNALKLAFIAFIVIIPLMLCYYREVALNSSMLGKWNTFDKRFDVVSVNPIVSRNQATTKCPPRNCFAILISLGWSADGGGGDNGISRTTLAVDTYTTEGAFSCWQFYF